MKSRFNKMIIWLVAVVVLASSAYAQPVYKDKNISTGNDDQRQTSAAVSEGKKGHFTDLVKELNLNPEQQQKVKELRKVHKETMKQIVKSLCDKRKELKEELEKPGSDKGRINKIASEIKTLQGKLIDERVENILQLKTILTAEQFTKFNAKTRHLRRECKKGKMAKGAHSKRAGEETAE